ncbi:MAG: FtsX-like permease family protein [Acidobacteriaceae bacterium]|nr:FtsX-like permease family protein [Acidobacteriaceae bacterium]MBV9779829.1 FtsX-like permease family protein [Acidobacteriaceae bacterium]
MKTLGPLLVNLIVRPMGRERVRTALTLFAVALGVGVVIAIDLAGAAAAGSFHSSLESLAGKSTLVLHQTGGIDQSLLGRLVQLPYAFDFAPRIEDFASINGKGEALPFLGLDLIGHPGQHEFQNDRPDSAARDLAGANPVWVGQRLKLRPGDQVSLLINDSIHRFTVRGILKTRRGEIAEKNAIVADIGLAQQVTGSAGKLDSIDVTIPPDHSVDYWREILAKNVPAGITIDDQGSRTEENRKMLTAFRSNLRVLSYIALLVGAFLIYSTIEVSVVRRRADIGIVRALGATRKMVATAFLAEALVIGLVGSVLGVVIGRVMAQGAVALIGSTVQSLYVSSEPAPIALTGGAILIGIGTGLLVSMLAALAPAIEASQVAPVEAMARGRQEYITITRSGKKVVWAAAMFATAVVLSKLPPLERQPIFAYAAALLLVAGTASAIPATVSFFEGVAKRAVSLLLGVEGSLALHALRASLGRTSVLTSALATAVAMSSSVGIMVGSFRETVWVWMEDQLKADFYLSPAGRPGADRHPTMDPGIGSAIERLPGVAAVDRARSYTISYAGLPATLMGAEISKAGSSRNTRFMPGQDRNRILGQLGRGDYAIISEPFANKHGLGVGSEIVLPLRGGKQTFKVLGVYYDYSTERGIVLLDWHTLLKYLPDAAPSSLVVFLKSGADPEAVHRGIDGVIAGRPVMVLTSSKLRREGIAVFDRTFRITYALEAVAVTVAVLGIAGALLALVIDRRREFALVRFLGGAQVQIRRIILCEAGLLGLLANGIGLGLGTLLSLLLVFVINKQSFGWTIQFHWPVALLLAVLTTVFVATLLAGIYPAGVATRMNPIEVIHEE